LNFLLSGTTGYIRLKTSAMLLRNEAGKISYTTLEPLTGSEAKIRTK